MASRNVARETAETSGELALGGQHRPARIDAQPDQRGQLLDARLEGVVAAHRSQDNLGQTGTTGPIARAGSGEAVTRSVFESAARGCQWSGLKPFACVLWTTTKVAGLASESPTTDTRSVPHA